MKLMVNGVMRNVSDDQLETFEDQFAELVPLLKQTNQTPKSWVESFSGNDSAIRVVLAQAKLSALATDMGIVFLHEKSKELEIFDEIETTMDGSCPLAPHRAH